MAWRRIVAASGHRKVPYDLAQDAQGAAWAKEREARRQAAVGRHAGWVKERQEAKGELRTQVWLPADTSRRLRTIATRPAGKVEGACRVAGTVCGGA